jgi:hypothetical protein
MLSTQIGRNYKSRIISIFNLILSILLYYLFFIFSIISALVDNVRFSNVLFFKLLDLNGASLIHVSTHCVVNFVVICCTVSASIWNNTTKEALYVCIVITFYHLRCTKFKFHHIIIQRIIITSSTEMKMIASNLHIFSDLWYVLAYI